MLRGRRRDVTGIILLFLFLLLLLLLLFLLLLVLFLFLRRGEFKNARQRLGLGLRLRLGLRGIGSPPARFPEYPSQTADLARGSCFEGGRTKKQHPFPVIGRGKLPAMLKSIIPLAGLFLCSTVSAQVYFQPEQYQFGPSPTFYYGGSDRNVFDYAARSVYSDDIAGPYGTR